MSAYTERFTEVNELLVNQVVQAGAAEANTGWLDVSRFHRVFAQVIPIGAPGVDIDVDIEEATSAAGANAQALDGGNKDITINAADTAPSAIEIRGEEFDVNDGFRYINIETTPAGQSATYVVQVFGIVPRYAAVATTNWDSITD